MVSTQNDSSRSASQSVYPDDLYHHHRGVLSTDRRFTSETIEIAQFWSVSDEYDIAVLRHRKLPETQYCHPDRLCHAPYDPHLVIPYFDPWGSRIDYARLRPDNPALNDRGKPMKYIGPSGKRTRIYFPPGIGFTFLDVSIPLFVVEGEFKALLMCQCGYATVALPGVTCWSEKNGARRRRREKGLHEDLAPIAWKGRRVFIVFDNDIHTNPMVAGQAKKLRRALKKAGAKAHTLCLPYHGESFKSGPDDLIKDFGQRVIETHVRKVLPDYRRSHNSLLMPESEILCRARTRVGGIASPMGREENPPLLPQTENSLQTSVSTPNIKLPDNFTGSFPSPPIADYRLQDFVLDRHDTSKPCQRGLTVALTKRRSRLNAALDGTCGRWGCTACNPRMKDATQEDMAAFLHLHRSSRVSLVRCKREEWKTIKQKIRRDGYELGKADFAFLRCDDEVLVACVKDVGLDSMSTLDAWEPIKQFIRGMNPKSPEVRRKQQCKTVIPLPPDEVDEEEEGGEEAEPFEREGVYAKNTHEQEKILAQKNIKTQEFVDPPEGITRGMKWDASGMSDFEESATKDELGLKRDPWHKSQPECAPYGEYTDGRSGSSEPQLTEKFSKVVGENQEKWMEEAYQKMEAEKEAEQARQCKQGDLFAG